MSCLTHDDRDCELWVESEGSLTQESQQFGPWLKAAPFMPSRRYMVRVPGFFARKKAGSSSEKPSLVKKAPVTVVRSRNLAPEIIRTEKERPETHVEGNMESVFNEGNSQETSLALDEGIKEDVMPHQPEQIKRKVSDEVFEEEIREIDKGIKKYDTILSAPPGFAVNMEKEKVGSQHNIYEQQVPCPATHAANVLGSAAYASHVSPSTSMPQSESPSSFVNHVHDERTWKRLTRIGVASEVCMAETVEGKKRQKIQSTILSYQKKEGFSMEVQQKIRYW